MRIQKLKTDEIKPYEKNPRKNDEAVDVVAKSLEEFGFQQPLVLDADNVIVVGHTRFRAAKKLGLETVPCVVAEGLTDEQINAYRIMDNKSAEYANWDNDLLLGEITSLIDSGYDLELTGFSEEEITDLKLEFDLSFAYDSVNNGALSDKFGAPPFSVLNARAGYWQDRKKMWVSLGIESEQGRDDNLLEYSRIARLKTGTSVFDPVLCELVYKWFSAPGAKVLDPFAGGSVRGIVAAKTGRSYFGIDLRAEQIKANELQAKKIAPAEDIVWKRGNSQDILSIAKGVEADLIFTCPPYSDLEVYSDDPEDLSTMDYGQFIAAYRDIISKSCSLLRDNSFAAVVVGEIRDKAGVYRNFVGDTVKAFIDAGLDYYNEAILVTMIGSLPLRTERAFNSARKLGKTHQNVLVFVKGDPIQAAEKSGVVDFSEIQNGTENGERIREAHG